MFIPEKRVPRRWQVSITPARRQRRDAPVLAAARPVVGIFTLVFILSRRRGPGAPRTSAGKPLRSPELMRSSCATGQITHIFRRRRPPDDEQKLCRCRRVQLNPRHRRTVPGVRPMVTQGMPRLRQRPELRVVLRRLNQDRRVKADGIQWICPGGTRISACCFSSAIIATLTPPPS